MRMRNRITGGSTAGAVLAAFALGGALATASHAAVVVTSTGASTFTGFSNANTADTTAGIASAYTQADYDAKLGQSVAVTTGGTLTDIQVLITGGGITGSTVSLALYDAGVSAGNGLKDTGSNGYGTADSTDPYTGSFSHTTVSDNLLTSAAQNLTLPAPGGFPAIYDFQFSGADAVSILGGEEYVVEINSSSLSNVFFIRQASNATEYADGQAFKNTQPLNGSPARDWAVGLTVAAVPEPASLAALGIGAGMLFARRRRV